MTYTLDDFPVWHPTYQKFDRTLIAIAATGAGKTTFILDCLHNGGTERGMMLVTSPECHKTYGKHFPLLFCHDLLDSAFEETFGNVLTVSQDREFSIDDEWSARCTLEEAAEREKQDAKWIERCQTLKEMAHEAKWSKKHCVREHAQMKKLHDEETTHLKLERDVKYKKWQDDMRRPHSWTMVWDDLSNQPGALDHPLIEMTTKAGRHYTMKQYFACQGVLDFKPKSRDQLEWLAIAPNIQTGRLQTFLGSWIPTGLTAQKFEQILSVFAAKQKWLVINRRDTSRDPTKFIFQYRASYDPLPDQLVGAPSFRYAHKLFFDRDKFRRVIATVRENPLKAKKNRRSSGITASSSSSSNTTTSSSTKLSKKASTPKMR